jgi:hypothetical protein
MKPAHRKKDKVTHEKESLRPDGYIFQLLKKLKRKNIKYQRIIQRCEAIDKNNDHIIHISDLEDILIEYLGIDNVSRREITRLGSVLENRRMGEGSVDYYRLQDLLDTANASVKENNYAYEPDNDNENWFDPEDQAYESCNRGSVGELLQLNSCPAERRNFRRFVLCLEEFERVSGMKAHPTEDGFLIPLGPDVKVKVSFSVNERL